MVTQAVINIWVRNKNIAKLNENGLDVLGNPLLTEEKLEGVALDAVNKKLESEDYKPEVQFDKSERDELVKRSIEKQKKEKVEIEETSKNDDSYIRFGKYGAYVDIDAVVNDLRASFSFQTIYGKNNEDIYFYEDGIWTNSGREVIESEVETLLGSYAKTKVVNEIVKKIKRQTSISFEEFNQIPEELIPLQNGILNFKSGEFFDYSPKYYFKSKLTPKYDPKAECPIFMNFLNETLAPEDIPAIQEWYGFTLYRRYFIKKGVIFVGDGDTGKTVLLTNLIKFIGTQNTTGINLQRITNEDKFALASLHNKYLNAYDDLSSKDINNGGGFKIVTGGGYNTAEVKFGDPFQFINFAKMTFSCNKIPSIKDSDDWAYYNRFMPFEFNNIVDPENQDKFLIDKISTEQELSGILNWAIEGLNRLLVNNKFSYNKTPAEVKRIMDRSSDSLSGFVQDCLIKCDGAKITKEVMFEIYSYWADKKGITGYSKEQIGRRLEKVCPFIAAKTGTIRFWENADINWENMKNIKELDTLDTFKKIYICEGINNYRLDIIKKDVSNPSKKSTPNNDTLDTFSRKDKKYRALASFQDIPIDTEGHFVSLEKNKLYTLSDNKVTSILVEDNILEEVSE